MTQQNMGTNPKNKNLPRKFQKKQQQQRTAWWFRLNALLIIRSVKNEGNTQYPINTVTQFEEKITTKSPSLLDQWYHLQPHSQMKLHKKQTSFSFKIYEFHLLEWFSFQPVKFIHYVTELKVN